MKRCHLNIAFRTRGGRAPGKELGLGHVYRCINLAYFLKRNKLYFLLEDFGGAKKIVRENGIREILSLKPEINLKSDIQQTVAFIHENKIDVLVIDSYKVKPRYLEEVKKHVKVVLISDLRNIDFSADLVINGFIGFDSQTRINKYGSKCLLGPSFYILNHHFIRKSTHKKPRYDLLATFGGYDENKIIDILLESMIKFQGKLKIKIILGPLTKKTKKIKSLVRKYGKSVDIVNMTRNMHDEIANSKYGICSGGITTYEFASLGVPFGIISQVKHQLITASEWEKRGIAYDFGLVGKETSAKVDQFLQKIILHEIFSSTTYSVDGKGGQRVAKEIMRLF